MTNVVGLTFGFLIRACPTDPAISLAELDAREKKKLNIHSLLFFYPAVIPESQSPLTRSFSALDQREVACQFIRL